MKATPLENKIQTIIDPVVTHMGYDVVRVQVQGGEGRGGQVLQVMAERKDSAPMTVDDCETISRQLSAVLDVEDVISDAYHLEVSSPGIDRPLTRPADFDRFKGLLAVVELLDADAVTGRRRFRGKLLSHTDTTVTVKSADTDETWTFDFDGIAKAKLVLTDDLIDANASN